MSIIECGPPKARGPGCVSSAERPVAAHPLHRIAEVRRQQGISRRILSRRLKVDVGQIKWQEQETSDMLLSALYQWQAALEVPVGELLVETGEPLSPPIMKRAQMLRLMKTVVAIEQRAQQPSIQRMAEMLVSQILEIMPELEGVGPWHAVGQRRTMDEVGRAAERCVPGDAFPE
jgi:transcriptional regulator with XRE-family HTH domain